ncbi:MAG TPA: hypothetical protein VHM90_09365, partial [Phycisphaerae bacterium]|nr:hypothetical protein [Phycisphaerae bacterium]
MITSALHAATPSPPATPSPAVSPKGKAEILAAMEKMADAQLAQPGYRDSTPNDWVAGAFYVGLTHLSHVSQKPKDLAAEKAIAEKNNWEFKTNSSARNIAMADNETIGQMYIDVAATEKDLAKLDKIKAQWDGILAGFNNPTPEIIRSWNGDLARDGKPMPVAVTAVLG